MPVRQIKAGYCNLTAKVPSKKLGRSINAESSLERDFILLLDNNPNVIHFEEQPLTIEYFNVRKLCTYTPDFYAEYDVGHSVVYEVKYREELAKNWQALRPKFKAAIALGKEQGFRFKIVTENEIRTPRLKNIEFLSHFSRTLSATEEAMRLVLIESLALLDRASPKELLAACFSCREKRAEAAPVLWRLITDSIIDVDLDLPLTMLSSLTLSDSMEDAF